MVRKLTAKIWWIALILNLPVFGQQTYKGWLPYYPGMRTDTTIGVYIKNTQDGYAGFYAIRQGDTAKLHLTKEGILRLQTDTTFKITSDFLYFLSPPVDTASYFLGIQADGKVVRADTAGMSGSVDSTYFFLTDEYFTTGWYGLGDTVKIDSTFIPPGSIDTIYFWWTDSYSPAGWYGLGDTVKIDTTFVPPGSVDSIYFLQTDEYFTNGWYGLDDTVRIDTSGSSIIYDTLVEGFGVKYLRYTPSLRDTVEVDSLDLDDWFVTDTLFNYTVDSIFTYVNDSLYSYLYDTLYISLSDTLFNYFYDTLYNTLYDSLFVNISDSVFVYFYDSVYNTLYDSLYVYLYDSLFISVTDSIYSYFYDSLYVTLYDSLFIYLHDSLFISVTDSVYSYFYDSLFISLTDSLIIYVNDSLNGYDSTYFEFTDYHSPDGWYRNDTVRVDTTGINFWTLNGNHLYPNNTTDSVIIGGTSPGEILEVTGNMRFSDGANRKVYVEKSTVLGADGYNLEIYAGNSNDPGESGTGKGGDVIIHGGTGDGGGSPAGGNVFIYPINQDQDGSLFLNLDTDTLSSDTRIYLGGVYTKDNATDSVLVLSRDHTLSWLSKDSLMSNAGDSCLWEITTGDTIDTKDFNIKLDSSFLMSYGDWYLGYGNWGGWDSVLVIGVIKDTSATYHAIRKEGDVLENVLYTGNDLAGFSSISLGTSIGEPTMVLNTTNSDSIASITLYGLDIFPPTIVLEVESNIGGNAALEITDTYIKLIPNNSLIIDTLPQSAERFLMMYDSTSGQVSIMDTTGWGGGSTGGADSIYFEFTDSHSASGWAGLGDTVQIDTSGAVGGADSIYFLRSDEYFDNGWYQNDTVKIDTTGGGTNYWTYVDAATDTLYNNQPPEGTGVIFLKNDVKSDRWLDRADNTVFGIDAMGNDGLTHSSGTQGYYNTMIGNGAGYSITSAHSNTFIGMGSGYSNTTGTQNVAIGREALYYNAAGEWNMALGFRANYGTAGDDVSYCTAIGYGAAINNQADYTTAIGSYSLTSQTTGSNNLGIGAKTLYYNTTGQQNIAIGHHAAYGVTGNSQSYNIAIGYYSLYGVTSGGNNISIGHQTDQNNTTGQKNVIVGNLNMYGNKTGSYNTAIGHLALAGGENVNRSPNQNVAIGYQALYSDQDNCDYNTAVGVQAGYSLTTGDYNVFLGYKAGYQETTGSYKLHIEAGASTTTPLIYGEFDNDIVRVYGTKVERTDKTIADNDATPDVSASNLWTYAGSANAVTITDLDNPDVGAIYYIIGNSDTYTVTIADSSPFNLSAQWVGGVDDVLILYVQADNDYIEIGRSDN